MFPLGEAVKQPSLRKTCKQHHAPKYENYAPRFCGSFFLLSALVLHYWKKTRPVFAIHFSFCPRLFFTTEKITRPVFAIHFSFCPRLFFTTEKLRGHEIQGPDNFTPPKKCALNPKGENRKIGSPEGPSALHFFLTKIPSTRLLSERLSNYLR